MSRDPGATVHVPMPGMEQGLAADEQVGLGVEVGARPANVIKERGEDGARGGSNVDAWEVEVVRDAGDVGVHVDLEGTAGADGVGSRKREAIGGNGTIQKEVG